MRIHFIGIGGIGVSALAQYFLKKGHIVSGSDLVSSEITDFLKRQGAKIYIGKHKRKNLSKNIDLVIYSPAVNSNNPELLQVANYKLQAKSYPQALGDLTKKYFTIAVSGTHGKSTTVAMVSSVLIKAKLDPTVIIGTKLKEFNNSNCRVGKGKYLIIEADEWQASFLNYFPEIIILTNIEREHLDYFKNLIHILKTYKEYINHLPEDGILIANKDDKNIYQLAEKTKRTKIFYSSKQKEAKKLRKILRVAGIHNISNALAVLAVARILKIPDRITYQALSEYKGDWRRFEVFTKHIKGKPYTLISDYAHHPTEIKVTLRATKEKFKKRKIWAIFQPHQYQRTYYFFNDFARAFDLANEVIITDIYDVAGREKSQIVKKVSAEKLASAIKKRKRNKKVHFISNFKKIPKFLKNEVKSGDIILIMGAGTIYQLVDHF